MMGLTSSRILTIADRALVFDLPAFRDRMMNDEELMGKVQKCFLKETPEQLVVLKKLVAQGEFAQAGAEAHKIKGAAGCVSGEALCQAAADVESAARKGDTMTLEQSLATLQHQFILLKRAMETTTGPGKVTT
jgi:HPt (histidine-containing phosphotransfer) domain-containing protein